LISASTGDQAIILAKRCSVMPLKCLCLCIDSVMIKYMKELHYGVFNNQSSAKSDFSLSIGVAQMKRVPIPFMAHK
jgi:hypothetical protein